MIRNGDVDGILTWCPKEAWDSEDKVLVLDYLHEGYKVFYMDVNGDESETHPFDQLSDALIYFAQQLLKP